MNSGTSVALHFLYCNFGPVHKTLRVIQRWKLDLPIMSGRSKKLLSLEHNSHSMIHRLYFVLMAFAQVYFAIRILRSPQDVKDVNIRLKTIWAKLPIPVYRGLGFVCAGAAILFFYLALKPNSD